MTMGSLRPAIRASADDDRPRIAQPDITEGFDHHRRKRCQPPCLCRSGLVGGNKADFLAGTVRMDGFGEGGNLGLGRRKVVFPKARIAWEADPDGIVWRPFGGWRGSHAGRLSD